MNNTPPEPKLAATVLIIRDGEVAPEVLMVQRHYQIEFAGGALVFPGGKVAEEDSSADWDPYTDGDFGPVQQDARIAAVREAFEESGLLLARPRSDRGPNRPLVGPDVVEKLDPFRAAIDKREVSFLKLIREHDLVLALDSLIYFGHWIAPPIANKRFDTHFYIAPAPKVQTAAHDGRETTDSVWLQARDALDGYEAGKYSIVFPTRMNLTKLSRATSVQDAVERFEAEPVVTVAPQVGKSPDGEPCLYIPEEAGYGQTMELISRIGI